MEESPPEASRTLSEFASKQLLDGFGVSVTRERLAADADAAVVAAGAIGFPVVVKLCGERIAHKSERDGVRLGLGDAAAVREAAIELFSLVRPEDGDVSLLVAEMVRGQRELIAGLVRDPQFGPCVMLGLGGILTEALGDVVFAAAPVSERDAHRMIGSLAASHLITGSFRGDPAVDSDALVEILVGLSRLARERPDIASVDLNPLIVAGDRPIAVDALVELRDAVDETPEPLPERSAEPEQVLERFRPLFHPRGVAVAGVSGHPGKFGFVTFHNLLRFGYAGKLFAIKPDGAEVLGHDTYTSVDAIPDQQAELVYAESRERTIGNLGSRLSTNRIIREVAEAAGVPVIDVQALFQQYGARRQRYYNVDLIHDDCHPTPLGHQLIAEALAPLLRSAITDSEMP